MGNISACAGRAVYPGAMLLGYEFQSSGKGMDLERTRRLQTEKKFGRLSENPERGIAKREFHVNPYLDIYVSDVSLLEAFRFPAAAPCLGRSQDLAWIVSAVEIEMEQVNRGFVGSTLIRFPNAQAGGLILPPLADYYMNDDRGRVRRAGRFSRYQFVREGTELNAGSDVGLFHPSDSPRTEHAVVLHRLTD